MAQQFERRLINEYLREKYSDKHTQTRVWLGPVPPGREGREFMVVGRWADVVVFEPDLITIIEAKMLPDAKAIGQLKLYQQMFSQTPRFQQYWNRSIKKVFLTTSVDDHVKDVVEAEDIEYRIFRPDWVDYWEKRKFRI